MKTAGSSDFRKNNHAYPAIMKLNNQGLEFRKYSVIKASSDYVSFLYRIKILRAV